MGFVQFLTLLPIWGLADPHKQPHWQLVGREIQQREKILSHYFNYSEDMQIFSLSEVHSIMEEKEQGFASLCCCWLMLHERQFNEKDVCFTWGRVVWKGRLLK